MSTDQNFPEELKMFEPLFKGEYLNKNNLQSVFFVEENKVTFDSTNNFQAYKNFPKQYFVAEFQFPYSSGMRIGNYFVLSHVFQLDLAQIKTEIEEIGGAPILYNPKSVAVFIEKNFDSVTVQKILFGENGNDIYSTLAQEMLKKGGGTIGREFGMS